MEERESASSCDVTGVRKQYRHWSLYTFVDEVGPGSVVSAKAIVRRVLSMLSMLSDSDSDSGSK